jgi:hypothetical protein
MPEFVALFSCAPCKFALCRFVSVLDSALTSLRLRRPAQLVFCYDTGKGTNGMDNTPSILKYLLLFIFTPTIYLFKKLKL